MRCQQALDRLSDYIEGAVSPPMQIALENHFAECPSCARELASLRECLSLLQQLEPVDPPADFRAKVWARIEAQEQAAVPWWRALLDRPAQRVRVAATAVALVVFTAAALLLPKSAFDKSAIKLGYDWPLPQGFAAKPAADLFTGRPDLVVSSRSKSPLAVGEEAALVLEVQPKQDLKDARIVVVRPEGLLSSTRGISIPYGGRIIWQGSLKAGDIVSVPLNISARTPGVYRLLIRLEAADYPGYGCRVFVPVTASERTEAVTFISGNLSMDELLARTALATGIIVASDLSSQRPLPVNIPVTTPGRVVSQICSQRGLAWSVSDGVYNIYEVEYR
jgi:hypothetical protein